ncbi:hypothetical protein EL22_05490 [Halostagnicola sp. A56]|uniref:DUF5658 family protein n=1 Tax=Halostagnicola sp. A56 TaxID=1495067 RepID=UPI00049EB397|nr:DUF5658 family protein [Halostagnicola sp. A56]KDE58343.1 hypothetical protein EL22_05490 [Halostagnicola sp. A56]
MRSDAGFARAADAEASPIELEGLLWVAVGAALIGDVVTTFVGLHLGLTESNPIAHGAIDGYGPAGMVGLKLVAVAVGIGCRSLLPAEYRPIVPAGLALPWLVAIGINLYMISSVV